MIDRYTLPQMRTLTSDFHRFRTWHRVEVAAAQAQGAPGEVTQQMSVMSLPGIADIRDREEQTGHDVAAFLQAWGDKLPSEAKPWLHLNMTSSDLVDSANSMIIREAGELLNDASFALFEEAVHHALAYKDTVRVGRTHGQHAEITTWGHWMADFAFAAHRAHKRLRCALRDAAVAKLSGPVGDYKVLTRETEVRFASILGLRLPAAATQVVPRDFNADVVWACSQIATLIERLAVEIRLGQQTEIGELREPRPGSSPVGSSAMPHKRNPIVSEQLTGLARLVRSQVQPVQEGQVSWHERDISHSSVERVALWDALTLTHYMLTRARELVEGLEVDAARMTRNATDLNHGAVVSSAARAWLVANGLTDPQIAWNLMKRAADLAEYDLDPATASFHHHAFRVVSGWYQSPKSQERFPDFNPDWHAFSKAMELPNQISQNDGPTFRKLEGLLKMTTSNYARTPKEDKNPG